MNPEMGNVTRLAYRTITDELTLLDDLSTPEHILDYLEHAEEPDAIHTFLKTEGTFRGLSSVLGDIMIKAGICKEGDPDSIFIDSLYKALADQDSDCKNPGPRNKITVTRWINGHTISIRERSTVIEICFALKLDMKLTNELLNKCGFNSLNVRNATEATYLYCILNKRPLSAATSIISSYNQIPTVTNENTAQIITHSGHTTVTLEQSIMDNSSWESDDDFLNSFLIPNKPKFIGYATTAVKQYYRWKNILFITILFDKVQKELENLDYHDSDAIEPKEDLQLLFALKSTLNRFSENIATHNSSIAKSLSSSIIDSNELIKKDWHNAIYVLNCLRDTVRTTQDISSQKYLSEFLSSVMSTEAVLLYSLWSIRGEDGRIRRFTGEKGSSFNNSIMKEFPNPDYFTKFERDPSVIDEGMTLRKIIIIIYFIAYSYDFSQYISDYNFISKVFNELSFVEFIEELNSILSDCRLPKLYPANQFDWLILRCIRQFEKGDVDGMDHEDDPIVLFNMVLAYSFGDNVNESDD